MSLELYGVIILPYKGHPILAISPIRVYKSYCQYTAEEARETQVELWAEMRAEMRA